MNKTLLFITRHRLNENNGGANASKGYVRCFSMLFDDCTLIYPEFQGDVQPYIPSKFKLLPCHDGRSNIRKGLDMYRGVVSLLPAMARQHLATDRYDVVVIDHSFIAQGLVQAVKHTGAKLITIHHNVERDYLNDNRLQYAPTYRLPYLYFGKKAERDSLLASDVNLTLTNNDAAQFRSWYPNRELHLHQWGIFEYRDIAQKAFAPRPKGHHFIMTGSLYFVQSLYPILEFIDRYWPLLRQLCPDATLTIAGRNPSQQLFQACATGLADGSIAIVPNPDDMAALVAQADYYICPTNMGSGLKLRVIDGLKQGLPVLCHQVSAAGYEMLQTSHRLFAYSDEATFAEATRRMLAATPSPDSVYNTFRQHFCAEAGAEKLHHILQKENII